MHCYLLLAKASALSPHASPLLSLVDCPLPKLSYGVRHSPQDPPSSLFHKRSTDTVVKVRVLLLLLLLLLWRDLQAGGGQKNCKSHKESSKQHTQSRAYFVCNDRLLALFYSSLLPTHSSQILPTPQARMLPPSQALELERQVETCKPVKCPQVSHFRRAPDGFHPPPTPWL